MCLYYVYYHRTNDNYHTITLATDYIPSKHITPLSHGEGQSRLWRLGGGLFIIRLIILYQFGQYLLHCAVDYVVGNLVDRSFWVAIH